MERRKNRHRNAASDSEAKLSQRENPRSQIDEREKIPHRLSHRNQSKLCQQPSKDAAGQRSDQRQDERFGDDQTQQFASFHPQAAERSDFPLSLDYGDGHRVVDQKKTNKKSDQTDKEQTDAKRGQEKFDLFPSFSRPFHFSRSLKPLCQALFHRLDFLPCFDR